MADLRTLGRIEGIELPLVAAFVERGQPTYQPREALTS
jgi:hypothetical protein